MSELRAGLQRAIDAFVDGVLAALRNEQIRLRAGRSKRTSRVDGVREAFYVVPSTGLHAASSDPLPRMPIRAGANVTSARDPKPFVRWRHHASPAELEMRRQVVLAAMRALSPGFAKRDIARKSGFGVAVHGIVRQLVAEGIVIKNGTGRNTRYRMR